MNKLIILAAALLAFASCAKEPQKPNVVVVITDDQGYGDLACHGNPIIKTPNLDAFHDQSIRFTNYHVGTTCAPTRAGLMTGRNCNRNGVWHTINGASLLHEREYTLGNLFADNGYATGAFGKWHLGDAHPFRPNERGFQETLMHGGGGVGQTPDYWNNDYINDTYLHNGKPEKQKGYCTDVFFDAGIKFIEDNKDKPFFCYLSTNAPHGPYNIMEEYYNMYKDADLAEHTKRFYGMITHLDGDFARLRKVLDDNGLTENTILIFTTDNGSAAGMTRDGKKGYNAGMRGMKGSEYEGGHRVPFFIYWPKGGLTGGVDIKDLAAHVDVLPTLAELCGFDFHAKNKLDGMSLAKLLQGKEKATKRMLVTDTQRKPWPVKGKQSCVMTTDYRLIDGKELYYIPNDPGERTNVANEHPELVKEMNAFYNKWWDDISTTFEYSLFKVGDDAQNPIALTAHDGHVVGKVPWNQRYIREGEIKGVGALFVDVVKEANYKVEICRYPLESGLAIGAEAADGYDAKPNWDARPTGKALHFETAEVIANGKTYTATVDNDKQSVVFESIPMKKGFDEFSASFIQKDGTKYGAYYMYITRL